MKKIGLLFFVLILSISLISSSLVVANANSSGKIGNINWMLLGTVLSLTGTGEMNFNGNEPPWGKNITKVVIGEGITNIPISAFSDCTKLTSVSLPSTLKKIEGHAFSYCRNLNNVFIPESVVSIGAYAFEGCYNLSGMYIPKNVSSIGEPAFSECYYLNSINVSPENKHFTSVDGVLFSKDMTKILCYPTGKSGNSYTVPETVTYIAWDTFAHVGRLNEINLPDTITYIGQNAFFQTGIYNKKPYEDGVLYVGRYAIYSNKDTFKGKIKEGTKYIAGSAFVFTEAVDEIIFPSSLVGIGSHAFWGSSVKEVVIPKSVKSIEDAAFSECKNLTIWYEGTESDRNRITLGKYNGEVLSAEWHYQACVRNKEHDNKLIKTVNATCTSEGTKHYKCNLCSNETTEKISALGHDLGLWQTTVKATLFQKGSEERKCSRCAYSETRSTNFLSDNTATSKSTTNNANNDTNVNNSNANKNNSTNKNNDEELTEQLGSNIASNTKNEQSNNRILMLIIIISSGVFVVIVGVLLFVLIYNRTKNKKQVK